MGIRSNSLWGSAATAGLTAIVASLLVPLPAAHAEAKEVVTGSQCADVTVVAIGGSKTNDIDDPNERRTPENDEGEEILRITSMENKVTSYASEAIRAALPDTKSVKFVEVTYEPVDEYIGFNGTIHAKPEEYKAAVMGGSQRFIEAAQKASSECGDASLVFVGYGQGAGVIRVSLEKLSSDTQGKTKAVWLMSDAMHDGSGGDGFQYYDAYTGWDQRVNGFMRLSKAAFDADDEADKTGEEPKEIKLRDTLQNPLEHTIPSDMKNNIVSMCDGKDGFCSPSEDTNIMIDSSPLHYVKEKYLLEGAKWVQERVDGNKDYKIGNARGEITNGIVAHRGKGATWVTESLSEPAVLTKCISDYAVIGVRGSGEDIDGGLGEETRSTTDENGVTTEAVVKTKGGLPSQDDAIRMKDFSDILATASWGIKENLPESATIRFLPVLYEAQAVERLAGAMDHYDESIQDGNFKTQEMVRKLSDLCPNTQIILMGYSQGAYSAHLAIKELDRVYRDRLAGVYLIADPNRDKDDPSVQLYYDENSDEGFAMEGESDLYNNHGIARSLGRHTEQVQSDLTNRVIEICYTGDGVCNTLSNPFTEKHSTAYKEMSQFWGFPTEWASTKLLIARSRSTLPQGAVADSEFILNSGYGYESPWFGITQPNQGYVPYSPYQK